MKNTLRAKEDFTHVKSVTRPNIVNSGPFAGPLRPVQDGVWIGFRSFLDQIGEGSPKRLFYHKVASSSISVNDQTAAGSARTWNLSSWFTDARIRHGKTADDNFAAKDHRMFRRCRNVLKRWIGM